MAYEVVARRMAPTPRLYVAARLALDGTQLIAMAIRDAGSLPDDVRSRKTDSGYPHRERTAMRDRGYLCPSTR
jgi:hypothetical protein